jgi:type IV secretory pathway VirB2 component (pilin)
MFSTATACVLGRCWAADGAILPWDYPLDFLRHLVTGPLAHSVISLSTIAAMLVFALAGDCGLARRFAKAAVGTGLALIVVRLLDYLAP